MSEPLINGGYILLSRKIIESEIFKKPPLYLKVWVYLLSSAQHKPYKSLVKGQLYTSIPEIQEACSHMVGYRKEVPTKDQIYNILEWLRKRCEHHTESDASTTMITTTRATHGLVVNIDKYSFYQDSKNYESNGESNDEKVTKTIRKQRQADNINKNDKNDKNVKKNIYGEYKHVKLTEEEHEKIFKDYGNDFASKCIKKLDEYIETRGEKNCKYVNHNLVIRGWVQDAVKDSERKSQPRKNTNQFNSFPQREYTRENYSTMEQRLLNKGG